MEKKEIKKKLLKILVEEFTLNYEPDKDDDLDDLSIGSGLEVKNLRKPINKKFNIDIDKSEIKKSETVKDLIDLIWDKVNPNLRGNSSIYVSTNRHPLSETYKYSEEKYYHYTTKFAIESIKKTRSIKFNSGRIFFTNLPPDSFDEVLSLHLFRGDILYENWAKSLPKMDMCVEFSFLNRDSSRIKKYRDYVYYLDLEEDKNVDIRFNEIFPRERNPLFSNPNNSEGLTFGFALGYKIANVIIKLFR